MYMDSGEIKYTIIDDIAWELFKLDWDFDTMTKNKGFFVYFQKSYPYCRYYDKAKLKLRRLKIQDICTRLEIR